MPLPEARQFTDAPAARERVPLLVGLVSPSGWGKTFSMLRLLSGIQKEVGGDVGIIDTEARRSLWYADRFKFHHLDFKAPFGPLDYLAAIEHFYSKGVRNIGVDSWSHEHEGPGGVLEMHATEMQRLMQAWKTSADKTNLPAWAKPKSERRRLLNCLTQLAGINMLGCFRAKEKIKIVSGKEPIQLGWMPIAGEEFIYEMTMCLLLEPGGVPNLAPSEVGEKALLKIPEQFRPLMAGYKGRSLDEELGAALARWAKGEPNGPLSVGSDLKPPPDAAALVDEMRGLFKTYLPGKTTGSEEVRGMLQKAFREPSWVKVVKLPLSSLALGLEALKTELSAAVAAETMREREPGEDPEEDL